MKTKTEQKKVSWLGTLTRCVFFQGFSLLIVWLAIRYLGETWFFAQFLTGQKAAIFALSAAFFMFVVVSHMKRGGLEPQSYTFSGLYAVSCLLFCMAALPEDQRNIGTASIEMAFFLSLMNDIREERNKRKRAEA